MRSNITLCLKRTPNTLMTSAYDLISLSDHKPSDFAVTHRDFLTYSFHKSWLWHGPWWSTSSNTRCQEQWMLLKPRQEAVVQHILGCCWLCPTKCMCLEHEDFLYQAFYLNDRKKGNNLKIWGRKLLESRQCQPCTEWVPKQEYLYSTIWECHVPLCIRFRPTMKIGGAWLEIGFGRLGTRFYNEHWAPPCCPPLLSARQLLKKKVPHVRFFAWFTCQEGQQRATAGGS